VNIQPTRLAAGLTVQAIPAFVDNYLWLLRDNAGNAVAVDPGDGSRVQEQLSADRLDLRAILLTHHHHDHVDGVAQLVQIHRCPVYGPRDTRMPMVDHVCTEGDRITLTLPALSFEVWHMPGHTLSHLAFIGHGAAFVGDTLFSAGCGRVFEGTPAQMLNSLDRLAALPPDTIVFSAHEYTRDNLRFALDWEPENLSLQRRYSEVTDRLARGIGSLPTTIADELAVNPFLRCDEPGIRKRLHASASRRSFDRLGAFTELRALKNGYVARH
jgi:hydroxyacylglutathione hydrolase